MGAECDKHGVDLHGDTFNGLVCPVCEIEAERDRYREALHRIALGSSGDTPLPMGRALGRVHQIARRAIGGEAVVALAEIAPRIGKAHQECLEEIAQTRPCGRVGWCCACWVNEQRNSPSVAWLHHERTPWIYSPSDPRYAPDWSYTLIQHHGGFRQRVYDWELEHA